ncbi:hypothetical protein [Kitasatospora sp. NPDC017646]|uniref:hypothetical protein n=1 Tax=Kitasatospora sp. NPDC017646 TaxID=3364024 RepID=UPI00379E9F96
MTTHRLAPAAASVKKAAAVAALLLAATGAATSTAWADEKPVVPCANGAVKLPGETAVTGDAVHHGSPTITVGAQQKAVANGDSTTYQVRITETNHTGAAYRHVTAVPVLFTQLGVMNTGNTTVSWVHDGTTVALPTRMGCDPSVWVASGALDAPLADGQTVNFDLKITTPTSVAEKVKTLSVTAFGAADGDRSLTGNDISLPGVVPAAQPTTKPAPTSQPTTKPAPTNHPTTKPTTRPAPINQPVHQAAAVAVPAAATAPVSTAPIAGTEAAPATAPTPATKAASLAFTGGGGNSGTLLAGAAALLAAGAAVLFGVKRRARRGN